MLKRIFWLALLVLGGWLLWSLWRQRQGTSYAPMPQFAPIAPATPSEPGISSAAPAPVPAPATTPAQPPPPPSAESNGANPNIAPSAGTDTGATPSREAADNATPSREAADNSGAIVGYCTRCREKRPIQNAHEELTESGRRAARGTCPVCGGNMYTFLKKEPAGE